MQKIVILIIATCLLGCSGERTDDPATEQPAEMTRSVEAPAIDQEKGVKDELARVVDQQLDHCTGRWVYINKTQSGPVSFGLVVTKTTAEEQGSFEMQFSDFGRDSGSWTANGTLDVAFQLTGDGSEYLLSECTKKDALLEINDKEVKLERATGDVFEEAAKRGIDYTENDG